MTVTKRISSDYTIATTANINLGKPGPGPNYELNYVNIYGNLNVFGSTTTVSTSDTIIKDKIVTLNGGEIGPGVSGDGFSGIEIDRGSGEFKPNIRWNESIEDWELTFDGVNWGTIVTTFRGLRIELDTAPRLGGDLDVNGFSIISRDNGNIRISADGQGQLIIENPLSLQHRSIAPLDIPGFGQLFAKSTGDSGIYFTNNNKTDQLASRRRSIAYAFLL